MSPPQAKNFENFAHFRVLRSNLAKSLTTGHPFLGGQLSKFWGGGGQNIPWPTHSNFWGGHGPPGPPGSATPVPVLPSVYRWSKNTLFLCKLNCQRILTILTPPSPTLSFNTHTQKQPKPGSPVWGCLLWHLLMASLRGASTETLE